MKRLIEEIETLTQVVNQVGRPPTRLPMIRMHSTIYKPILSSKCPAKIETRITKHIKIHTYPFLVFA